jgi:hypothetical protein
MYSLMLSTARPRLQKSSTCSRGFWFAGSSVSVTRYSACMGGLSGFSRQCFGILGLIAFDLCINFQSLFGSGVAGTKVLFLRVRSHGLLVDCPRLVQIRLRFLELRFCLDWRDIRPLAQIPLIGFSRQIVGLCLLGERYEIETVGIIVGLGALSIFSACSSRAPHRPLSARLDSGSSLPPGSGASKGWSSGAILLAMLSTMPLISWSLVSFSLPSAACFFLLI